MTSLKNSKIFDRNDVKHSEILTVTWSKNFQIKKLYAAP